MSDLYVIAKHLVSPPGPLILLLGLATLLLWLRPRAGRLLVLLALLALYALATPAVAGWLARGLIDHAPLPDPAPPGLCAAIVVLGGGLYHPAPEFAASSVVSESTLWRLTYGAQLARQVGAPILVSGGRPLQTEIAEADAMREVLVRRFGQPPRWVEDQGRTTWEQAGYVADLLQPQGILRICLVTHANHMVRAERAFLEQGFEVVPAPTDFSWRNLDSRLPWLPRSGALAVSFAALQEYMGQAVYAVRRRLAL